MEAEGEDKPPPVEQELQVVDMTEIREEQESTTPSEREYNKKFEIEWGRKFEDPDNFKQLLWNEAGPALAAMVIACNLLVEEESSPTNEAIKSGLSPELMLFIEDKTGNTADEKIQLKKTQL